MKAERFSSGGRIVGPARSDDRAPYVLSRGAVRLTRAAFDALGRDATARINSFHDWSGTYPDITIVEPDGSVTEIEGSGP